VTTTRSVIIKVVNSEVNQEAIDNGKWEKSVHRYLNREIQRGQEFLLGLSCV